MFFVHSVINPRVIDCDICMMIYGSRYLDAGGYDISRVEVKEENVPCREVAVSNASLDECFHARAHLQNP